MGLVFDLAEAINLLAEVTLGEGAASLRERLADTALRRSLAKALRKAVATEAGLSAATRQEAGVIVSSSPFIALICGEPMPDRDREHVEAQFSAVLAQLSEPLQAVFLIHIRDAAVRALEASLPLSDRVLHRSVRQVSAEVSELSDMVKELRSNLGYHWVQPPLPIVQGKDREIGGNQYVSALALAVADVLGEYPVGRIIDGAVDAALIVDAYRAVDRLLSHFEEQAVVLLELLDKASFARNYYGSASVGIGAISGTNVRLLRISEQMHKIAEGIGRIPALTADFRERLDALANLCLKVVVLEDFLALRILPSTSKDIQYEDNLSSPMFANQVGEQTINDFSRNLIMLLHYRSSLHSAIVDLLHALPRDDH